MIKKIDLFIIIINIIFFAYYATQLLVFTDEFAINNLGFFNHAVAGLSEIENIRFFRLNKQDILNINSYTMFAILNSEGKKAMSKNLLN